MTAPRRTPPTIDLNADVGELPEALADGREEALFGLVTTANVACGGHAGDEVTMAATLALARRLGVAAGAHPGYPDRAGFGRSSLGMTAEAIEASVLDQVRALSAVAARVGCEITHVKPHGALYNDAARGGAVAAAVARAVARWKAGAVLVGLAGSRMLDMARAHGLRAVAEGFADRCYEPDGTLRARSQPGAMIVDPDLAAAQAVAIALRHEAVAGDGRKVAVEAATICIHGDSPGAMGIARRVRAALAAAGVVVAPLGARP